MNKPYQLVRLLGPAAVILVAGCAPAYHSYSDCNVNCKYCPPPPLQYTHYEGCVCHSCAAEPYLTTSNIASQQQVDPMEQPAE